MTYAIVGKQIFDGNRLLPNHAIVVSGKTIAEVIPQEQLSKQIPVDYELTEGILIPGLIDLQLNGGGGVLFNDTPTVEGIREIGNTHRRFGTTGFLPTLISTDLNSMVQAIGAVDEALRAAVPGVLGIHLEGPFLSPHRAGIHNASKFCVIDNKGLELITSLKNGVTLLTLAPEKTSPETIRRIVATGAVVCAGHSDADYNTIQAALDAGVSGFTHLFNAMSPLTSREPGMVGAALSDDNSWFGIIADGHHVHPATFKAAIAAKKRGGAVLVTDAMPTVGAKQSSFTLNGETISSANGRCLNAAGVLAGSDLNMILAVNNAAKYASIDWLEAVRMASAYPARAIGVDHHLGYLKPNYTANIVAVNAQREVVHSWINGVGL